MTDAIQKSAWNNRPIPNGLNLTEQLQYIMLRCIYRTFKGGKIPEEEAKAMKEYVVRYGALTTKAKGSLMQYCYAFLCEECASGNELAGADMAHVGHYYSLLLGHAPYNPVTDK